MNWDINYVQFESVNLSLKDSHYEEGALKMVLSKCKLRAISSSLGIRIDHLPHPPPLWGSGGRGVSSWGR
jgi:hypothetical protein